MPRALLDLTAYPHPAAAVTMIETHISWVFLAGELAYKIKKPVRLDFLDFSTLDRRRHFCEEELRINQRFAPQIYLGLSRVTREHDGRLVIDGTGEVTDFAVRMRRFDRDQELAHLLECGDIEAEDLYDLGARLAASHAAAPAADATMTVCDAERMPRALRDASHGLAALWPEARERLVALDQWADTAWTTVRVRQQQRRASGAFRQCHGDLHCGNVVRIDGRLTPFDALEFDPALSWIDPVSDLAFLLMDLGAYGRRDLAATALDGWLAASGDFDGLVPLRLFLVYRALVRALVNGIRVSQRADDAGALYARERYLGAAEHHTCAPPPRIIVMGGVSGSGKSWLAERLLAPLGAIRVRSDVERKRLAGLRPLEASGGMIYSPELTARTYERLAAAARAIVTSGHTAIVDAACLKRMERESLRDLARHCGVPAQLVWVTARDEVLAARVTKRRASAVDPSEATLEVLRAQQGFVELPAADELEDGLLIDTSDGVDIVGTVTSLRQTGQ